ncbi:MAG: hypothetical protein M3460_26930 [Actinomycetota bacterium]|nr:hypothetical protein [Actinomycetota bacterium]
MTVVGGGLMFVHGCVTFVRPSQTGAGAAATSELDREIAEALNLMIAEARVAAEQPCETGDDGGRHWRRSRDLARIWHAGV